MKALLLTVLLATPAVAVSAVTSAAASSEARLVVEETAQQVLDVLADKQASTGNRLERLERIAEERFDFDTISRLVLARNWKKLSEPQRAEFIREFKSYMSRNYGNRIDGYTEEKVDVFGEREEPRGDVTVLTRIVGGRGDGAEVQYRMRNRDGVWKVIDIVVEGISFVSSYRSQFKELWSRGGAENLLHSLREKNEAAPSESAA